MVWCGVRGLMSSPDSRLYGRSYIRPCGSVCRIWWSCFTSFFVWFVRVPSRLYSWRSQAGPRWWLSSFPDHPLSLSGLASSPLSCTHFRMTGPPPLTRVRPPNYWGHCISLQCGGIADCTTKVRLSPAEPLRIRARLQSLWTLRVYLVR